MKRPFLILLSLLLVSCTAVTPSAIKVVNVYATGGARPWLEDMYACAEEAGAVLNLTSESPQIQLHLGEPEDWNGAIYQVGTEEIVVVVQLQSPLGSLTLTQVNEIFSGKGDPSLQVWAFAAGDDLQKVFDLLVMNGRGVTSFARLAATPMQMSAALNGDVNAVGFLPRRWMTDGLKELLAAGSVPVLALTPSEPEGIARDLLACMRK
jgi:hypothetical protein